MSQSFLGCDRPPLAIVPESLPSVDGRLNACSPICDEKNLSTTSTIVPPSRSSLHTVESTTSTVHDDVRPFQEEPRLTIFRLFAAHIGAAMALFLATTDATIVSTSLPTIVGDLAASQNEYTWVGVAYMLTQTACQPLYGRISDIVGRECVLYVSMAIFAIGSLLCGAAQNITWLILARGLAGIGGGGIVSAVWVITSEIVEVRNRAKWSQALSVTWSCSAIAGPLLGGLFSSGDGGSKAWSWRWAFYLNLPVCLIAFFVLLFALKGVTLRRSSNSSFRTLIQRFDFMGLVLFMGGTCCIIVGLSFGSENGWSSPSTLILIVLGLVVLLSGGIYEVRTTREALFPTSVFRDLTTIIILLITFLHNVAFCAGTFYLALYFQAVTGATPLKAGLMLLPYSLGSSLASMPVAWFIGYRQQVTRNTSSQKWAIATGLVIATLGFGLMNLLDERSTLYVHIIFPLIAGVGLGMLFHAPYQVFTRALDSKEIATGTSAFFLVRFTGATVGLAVAGAVFYARVSGSLPANVSLQTSGSDIDLNGIGSIESPELKAAVLHSVSTAIQTIWTVGAPSLGVAALASLLLRNLSIEDENESDRSKMPTKAEV
ncbi:hypothetical protein HGRIS_007576 [Hohenbuehelia grisea]|uniref:Major facilitator superfamily (MFS) profile domain-containing protein n=1 Tax=Hohenbuehelia grisea TaxID=104357 RepID=A0ABR3J592_9AGAR